MRYIWLFILLIRVYTLSAQDFNWLEGIDFDDPQGIGDFEWKGWGIQDWKDQVKDEYGEYYKNADKRNEIEQQAYDAAQQEGFQPPRRIGPFTFDPEIGKLTIESDQEFAKRLDRWAEDLVDEAEGIAKDAALTAAYQLVEPLLLALKEKNVAILDVVLPELSGVPAWDVVNEKVKEKQQTKKNWKVWIKTAAEYLMQDLFKKNAEGKYELQRENVELLKQVGIIQFLKMSIMDWEIAQSLHLEVPDEILDYAQAIKEVYHSADATFTAGKQLYREVTTLDTELDLPGRWEDLRQLTADIATNQLTVAEMVNRRRKVLSGVYRQLAQQYEEDATDLRDRLKKDDELKMNDAERFKAFRIVQEYVNESIRLQHKADQLVQLSTQSPSVSRKDQLGKFYSLYRQLDELHQ